MTSYDYNPFACEPLGRKAPVTGSYTPAPEFGELQRLVDEVFEASAVGGTVAKLDLVMRAEIDDMASDLQEVIDLLPGGRYDRHRLCDQMNSIITAHGWGYLYGTVE